MTKFPQGFPSTLAQRGFVLDFCSWPFSEEGLLFWKKEERERTERKEKKKKKEKKNRKNTKRKKQTFLPFLQKVLLKKFPQGFLSSLAQRGFVFDFCF
jgi:hypothetical protein